MLASAVRPNSVLGFKMAISKLRRSLKQKDRENTSVQESEEVCIPHENGVLICLDSAIFLARFLATLSRVYKNLRNFSAHDSPQGKQ